MIVLFTSHILLYPFTNALQSKVFNFKSFKFQSNSSARFYVSAFIQKAKVFYYFFSMMSFNGSSNCLMLHLNFTHGIGRKELKLDVGEINRLIIDFVIGYITSKKMSVSFSKSASNFVSHFLKHSHRHHPCILKVRWIKLWHTLDIVLAYFFLLFLELSDFSLIWTKQQRSSYTVKHLW